MIAVLLAVTLFPATAIAEECNQDEALDKIHRVVEAGAIAGVGVVNDMPTITMSQIMWETMKVATKIGMFETLDCAILGPGRQLREVQVITEGGRRIGYWDGVSRQFSME